MQTSLRVQTPPAGEPLSLNEIRQHCRIDHASDDHLLVGFLTAARAAAEQYLGRVLINQTLLWTVRDQPDWADGRGWRGHGWGMIWGGSWRQLPLPRAPASAVTGVTVLDTLGNSTALAPATLPLATPYAAIGYVPDVALEPARLRIGLQTMLSGGKTLAATPVENIQVVFVAGYGADGSSVPEPILSAIKLVVAFLYENRGDAGGEMPAAARWLLDPYRIQWVA